MFASLHRLKIKVQITIYVILLIIISLLAFGVYAKFRAIQSVDFIESQSATSSEMKMVLEDIADSLNAIQIHLCLQGPAPEDC